MGHGASRPLPLLPSSPAPVVAAAVLGSALLGVLLALDVGLGVGLVLALAYLPVVLLDLPLAIALWVGIVFIEHLSFTSIGPTAAAALIALAWIGSVRGRPGVELRLHRTLLAVFALFLAWATMSAIWAERPAAVISDVWQWYVAAAVLMVVSTAVLDGRHLRLVAAGFVAGAVVSVLIGFLAGLDTSATAIDTATQKDGRLQGGGGDPNYLAAGLVPAIALAGGLAAASRRTLARATLVLTVAILAAGLGATQSRGGVVAGVCAIAAALLLFKGHRAQVVVLLLLAGAVGGAWLATTPEALERVTNFDGGGTGRSGLWEVAWRMSGDSPVVGVGLDNFQERAAEYVREPGALEYVDLIAEKPRLVHNVYLQLLAEVGIVGLALFLGVILAALRTALLAARRFDRLGDPSLALLSRAVLVAGVGALAASFFLSNGPDKRLWVILALGPALLAVAARSSRTPG